MIATTSLNLSKQLQERFGDIETDYYWERWYSRFNSDGKAPWQIARKADAERDLKNNLLVDGIVPAWQLEDCRIKALELIEASEYDHAYLKTELANILIQGCDPTATWMLATFGEGK